MHKTFDIVNHQETLLESNLNYIHYRRFIIAFRCYLSRISVKYFTSVFQLEQVATCETICHVAVCGAPRKQRIKRGQSHIGAQHSRIYIFSLPRSTILSPNTFHFFSPPTTSRFFLSPSSSDPQGRSLGLVVMFLVLAERTRTCSLPYVLSWGPDTEGVLPDDMYERETSTRWITAEGD